MISALKSYDNLFDHLFVCLYMMFTFLAYYLSLILKIKYKKYFCLTMKNHFKFLFILIFLFITIHKITKKLIIYCKTATFKQL